MKTKFIVLISVTLASFLIFSSVLASSIGVTTTISDYGSNFSSNGTTESGTSHLGHLSGDQFYTSAWGKWRITSPTTTTTNYAWKVYIPYNSGATDGAVKYTCYNDYEGSSGWPVIVNQENIWGDGFFWDGHMAMEVQWLLMPGWITLVRPDTDATHGMKSGGMMRNTDPAEMLITQEIVPLHSTN